MNELGEAIKEARKSRGWSHAHLGKLMGVSRAAISQWEKGQHVPKRDKEPALIEHLGIPAALLAAHLVDTDPAPSPQPAPAPPLPPDPGPITGLGPEPPAPNGRPMKVPVLGTAAAAEDADDLDDDVFVFNGGVVDLAPLHPGVANIKNVWSIYTVGESMVPWREPGELVYVHPTREPRTGDYVVVELRPKPGNTHGPALLKKLLGKSNGRVRLFQWNPQRDDIYIDERRIKKIYRVISWSELMGV